ncbi:MAG: hypothetical protein K2I81_01630 [Alphaproteobacteria bacterium]|nr:hypothetical protein [Alphaproteobacteria bacterium]
MQTNNKEIIVQSIKSGLHAFFEIAYTKAYRGSWYKRLPRSQQLQAGRAIFTLRDIAAAPEMHFSRGATESQWRARGKEYAKSHGLAEEWSAYYIVPSAADKVREKVEPAFWNDYQLRMRLYNFCETIQDWYYNTTSTDVRQQNIALKNGEDIIAMSKRICDERSIEKDGRAVHYINKFLENPMVQRMLVTGYSK